MVTAQKILSIIILLLGFLLVPKSAFASTLHLAPGGGNIAIGQTLAVQVMLNTAGTPVNGVTALLAYPADKLDVAYVSPGSAFGIDAEKVVGGGNIRISRGNISGVSGDVVVATIGFRGKVLGSANVSFISGSGAPSAASSNDTLNLGASPGGSFNIVAASAQDSPPAQVAGPKITDLKVVEVATSSATINWKTDKKSDSVVTYGVDRNQFVLSTAKSDLVTDHTIKLENLQFPPGTKLYFQTKSKDSSGNEGQSEINTIQLKGYRLIIKLTGKDGKLLPNIKVTLYSDPLESATNDQGQVVFENVPPGKHVVLIKDGNLEKSQDIVVADNGILDQAQQYSIQFDPSTSTTPRGAFNFSSKNTVALVVLGVSFLILAAIAIYVFSKRRGGGHGGSSSGDSNPFPFFDNNQSGTQTPVVIHPGQP